MAKLALRKPILCLVTDEASCLGGPLEQVVATAVEAGVGMVQLRGRGLAARDLLRLGRLLLPSIRAAGAALVVNDRLDAAVALGADGVQLGADSLSVADARRVAGDDMLIGASVHSLDEAARAESDGADYLVLGTIFETRSHPGASGSGVGLVREVAGAMRIPIVAIGGIDAGNAGAVMAAGASGVAVIRAIQSAEDVGMASRALLTAMGVRSQEPAPAGDTW